ncbi:MAG: autotransporter-associated beta strand repeat-containing protein [Verrucomicrobiota bacterium]
MNTVSRLLSVWAVAAALSVSADITVSPGASNPAYPPTNPDPFAVVDLDLEGNILTVDDGSEVTISDTLSVGGRVVLESGATVSAMNTALFDDAGQSMTSSGAVFVNSATFDAGTFLSGAGSGLYLGIDGGTVTTDGTNFAGGQFLGFGMDNGAQFISNGDFSFTGMGAIPTSDSTFYLGPLIADPSVDAGSFDGTEAAGNTANATLIQNEETTNQTAVSTAVSNYSGTGAIDATLGNDILFRVNGNANLGGNTSDQTLFFGQDSSFTVTGNLTFGTGAMISNLVMLGADLDVGGQFFSRADDGSSSSIFFVDGTIDVGEWNHSATNVSTSALTVDRSTIQIGAGGDFDVRALNGSVSNLNISDSTITNLAGGILMQADGGSVQATNFGDTPVIINGDLVGGADNSSIQSLFASGDIALNGGDFVFLAGNSSTAVASLSTLKLTGDSVQTTHNGGGASLTQSFGNIDFDLTNGFLIEGFGDGTSSDITVSLGAEMVGDTGITGSIGNDFEVRSFGNSLNTSITIGDFSASIGGNLIFEMPALTNSESRLVLTEFAPEVSGDVLFDVARSPGAVDSTLQAAVGFSAGGNVSITENTIGSLMGSMDVGGTIVNSGQIDFEIANGDTVSATTFTLANLASSEGDLLIARGAFSRGTLEVNDLVEGLGTGTVTFDGGIYRTTMTNAALFSTFEPGDIVFDNDGACIDTNTFDLTTTFPFAGPGGLTKLGKGTLALDGTSTYTGDTVVVGGTLFVNGSIINSDEIFVGTINGNSGNTLELTENASLPGSSCIHLAPGNALRLPEEITSFSELSAALGSVVLKIRSNDQWVAVTGLNFASLTLEFDVGSDTTMITAPGGGLSEEDGFQITGVQVDGDQITLTWESLPDLIYGIEYSPDLSVGGWLDVTGFTSIPGSTGSSTTQTFTNPLGTPASTYFRINRTSH